MSLLPVGISGEEAGYQIERSLRFNSADSAYLNRTPSSTTGRQVLTISFWCKRGKLGASQNLVYASDAGASNYSYIFFNSSDQLNFATAVSGVNKGEITTNAVFRDPSAWYHIVLSLNFATPTATIYVNGVSQSVTINTALSASNLAWLWTGATNFIGSNVTPANFLDGYMTEINFIDGSALTPTSFGEYNSDTGVWQPKAYTGTYGTNGFYLNFSDNSGVTSTTLGKDQAGSNNWTPNNFSVTAGAGNDSLVDTPTNYGEDTGVGVEVRGNYATLNPLANGDFGIATLTNGNLDASGSTNYFPASSTFALNTGKWYWEVLCTTREAGGNYPNIGLWVVDGWNIGSTPYTPSTTGGVSTWPNGIVGTPSGNTTYTTWTVNDIVNFAYDADTGKVYVGKNGTWFNSGNPAAGTGFVYQYTAGTTLIPGGSFYSAAATYNFGQRPFAYTAPSGFKALCTQNLPEPTIVDGGEYFNTVLYTGNAVQDRTITGVGFDPDLTWIKGRSNAGSHVLMNVLSGGDKQLFSNLTNAEQTNTDITNGFASDGFILGDNVSGTGSTNQNGYTYVAWNWKANGAGVSNTDGTITSTVSANTDSGFSIVTYTGTGSAATIGHGLGVAPNMVITKVRSTANNWGVYHSGINDPSKALLLDSTAAAASYGGATGMWNNTAPTSTVFSVGTNGSTGGSATYVAYCFAAIPGYSAMGSYLGNGSSDGSFVYTGFRPRFVLVKVSSASTGPWNIIDTARDTFNLSTKGLFADLSDAEDSGRVVDVLSNGFKFRGAPGNTNGATFIYAAFAESPFKYSLAR